jgi:hypothetical protein
MKTNKIKVYFMAITLVTVTILMATFVNFWHSILKFIYIPYALWALDRDRWWALLNAVINPSVP